MFFTALVRWMAHFARSLRTKPTPRTLNRASAFEQLSDRITPAVNAFFTGGQLLVIGDGADNAIVVSRDAAGLIRINGGAVPIAGGTPTAANTTRLQLFGLGGNDNLSLDESRGPLPPARMFGGAGNDVLTGGAAADLLFGQAGDDTLAGRGGVDLLFGGSDADALTGGAGADLVFGENGADAFIWNPGDGRDLNEGGAGVDTVTVNGSASGETLAVSNNGTRVRVDNVNEIVLDINGAEHLVLNGNAGDDVLRAGTGLAALIQITMNGGAGDDGLLGSDGADVLNGDDGNDIIRGGGGVDVARMGAGNDTFVWLPGDGSDVVEGAAGNDTLAFRGSDLAEVFTLSANGNRVRLTRDLGAVAMDLDGVEQLDLAALGGADVVTVNNVISTDLTTLFLNLTSEGGAGDGAADAVVVNASDGDDVFQVASFDNGARVAIAGNTSPFISIVGAQAANDRLTVNALGGADGVDAGSLAANSIALTLNGGAGDDELLAGGGNDLVTGGAGADRVFLEAGDDTFVWNPGDGSDLVEGMAGRDVMVFNGNDSSENFALTANGFRLRVTRDLGGVLMNLDDVEQIDVVALGGADVITVGDLSGTDVEQLNLKLAAAPGGATGDGLGDSIVVDGTNDGDVIPVLGGDGGLIVNGDFADGSGLPYFIVIGAVEAADSLRINARGGNDIVSADFTTVVRFTADGGAGDDVLTGSAGNDTLLGGDGDDTLVGGPGLDTLDGGLGNNIVIQD